MRRSIILLAVMALAMSITAPALAARGGDPGSPIMEPFVWATDVWGNDVQYSAIVQKSLKFNGNEKSYDLFYVFSDGEQGPISEAAPGDSDYNGGRWVPTVVHWNTEPYLMTSEDDLLTAAGLGHVSIDDPMYSDAFLCPLIPRGK